MNGSKRSSVLWQFEKTYIISINKILKVVSNLLLLFYVKERNKVSDFVADKNEKRQEYSLPGHDMVWSGR
jgi:hypothetical protein